METQPVRMLQSKFAFILYSLLDLKLGNSLQNFSFYYNVAVIFYGYN